jgi:hypothetical protein
MQQDLGRFFGIGFAMLGVACWFGIFVFGFKARRLRKPSAAPHRMHDLETYTDAGVRAFKLSRCCVFGFLACWALSVSIGIMTGAFKS